MILSIEGVNVKLVGLTGDLMIDLLTELQLLLDRDLLCRFQVRILPRG